MVILGIVCAVIGLLALYAIFVATFEIGENI